MCRQLKIMLTSSWPTIFALEGRAILGFESLVVPRASFDMPLCPTKNVNRIFWFICIFWIIAVYYYLFIYMLTPFI